MSFEIDKAASKYYEAWTGSLVRLLSQISASEWNVGLADAADCKPVVSLRLSSSRLPGGQWIGLGAADAGRLLQLFLGEEVAIPGELDDMQREALLELVRQWCGLAATALKPQFGELSFAVTVETSPTASGQYPCCLHATQGSNAIVVRMEMDNSLAASIGELEKTPTSPEPGPAQDTASVEVQKLLYQGNLDLLMDVELSVMLRFGKRQATLREVLELATGSVLELDREVQEPVDLVLHEKVIARGEVVVVDGNYGLRVSEVAPAQQRVSSL